MIPRGERGVVLVLQKADGSILASAHDFSDHVGPSDSIFDAQEHRAMQALAMNTVRALASPALAVVVDEVQAASMLARLQVVHGWTVKTTWVGWGAETPPEWQLIG